VSQPSTPARRVVLFDLDGVLTSRDTFATLVARRLARQPWRLPLALPALPLLALGAAGPRLRGAVSRYLVRVAFLGVALRDGLRESRGLGAEFAARPAWLRAAALRTVREHLERGDRVLVVTATEGGLARALLDGVGLADVELVASRLVGAAAGLRLWPHNYGAAKLDGLLTAGVSAPWDAMYSDSAADLALLEQARSPVLVSPSPSTVRRVAKALGVPPAQVRWD
jgi:phosphatidylglycerophosphatase C